MRARLLVVLLAFSLACVAGFAWPLLLVSAAERTRALAGSRAADLDRFCVLAQQPGGRARLISEATHYAALYGEAVVVVDHWRRPVVESGGARASDPPVAALIDGAMRNQPAPAIPDVRPWSRDAVLVARPVGDGTAVAGAVVLRVSVRAAALDVARNWTAVMAGALLAMAVFVLLALVLSRWVLLPLGELARGIQAVAEGTHPARVDGRAGPRELRALAGSFNRMSEAVSAAADQQSRLISDASHQLRNPMAALRLRVDSLAGSLVPAGEGAYRSVVGEVERLESLLDGLLALASAEHTATRVVVDALEGDGGAPCCLPAVVLLDRVDAWSLAATEAGVEFVPGRLDHACTASCPEGDLAQILDVLLDNAVKYAGPGAKVGLSCDRMGDDVRLTVADDGPGLSAPERALATTRFWRSARQRVRGSGLGLAIADQLVTAWGGRLELIAGEPTGLVVTVDLPRQAEA